MKSNHPHLNPHHISPPDPSSESLSSSVKISTPSGDSASPSAEHTPRSRSALGAHGERVALEYLETSGYALEAKNWRGRRGELDLIMRHESTLVIIEVRTTSTRWLERPAEATSLSKQRQVARCADEYYQQRHPKSAEILDIRFDVIGVLITSSEASELATAEIDHIEDAYCSPFAY